MGDNNVRGRGLTVKEQILRRMSESRFCYNSAGMTNRLGLNNNTVRGRLSELARDHLIDIVSFVGSTNSYHINERGRLAASRI